MIKTHLKFDAEKLLEEYRLARIVTDNICTLENSNLEYFNVPNDYNYTKEVLDIFYEPIAKYIFGGQFSGSYEYVGNPNIYKFIIPLVFPKHFYYVFELKSGEKKNFYTRFTNLELGSVYAYKDDMINFNMNYSDEEAVLIQISSKRDYEKNT